MLGKRQPKRNEELTSQIEAGQAQILQTEQYRRNRTMNENGQNEIRKEFTLSFDVPKSQAWYKIKIEEIGISTARFGEIAKFGIECTPVEGGKTIKHYPFIGIKQTPGSQWFRFCKALFGDINPEQEFTQKDFLGKEFEGSFIEMKREGGVSYPFHQVKGLDGAVVTIKQPR